MRYVIISRITRYSGDRYIIPIPHKYRDLGQKLHGKYVRVIIEDLEDSDPPKPK